MMMELIKQTFKQLKQAFYNHFTSYRTLSEAEPRPRRQITTLTATYQDTNIDSLHSLSKKNEDLLYQGNSLPSKFRKDPFFDESIFSMVLINRLTPASADTVGYPL